MEMGGRYQVPGTSRDHTQGLPSPVSSFGNASLGAQQAQIEEANNDSP